MNTPGSIQPTGAVPITQTLQQRWLPLLAEFGATLNEFGEVVFADTPAQLAAYSQNTTITPLAQHGLLTILGPDSAKFLQGQLTCNVLEVNEAQSTPGAYCTQKGRMLTSFYLAQHGDNHYWLRMRSDVLENSHRTLSKYAVFSKAKLAMRDDLVGFGLHGAAAAALVKDIFGVVPNALNGTVNCDDSLLLQRDAGGHWFECWMPEAAAAAFWQRCRAQCGAAGSAYWRSLGISAGLGEVTAATAELFIPQMLNYQLTGAVSFNKGCYTGQEIIARTHYRGQVKRHLLRAISTHPAPVPGSEIMGGNGQAVGNVVDSVAIDTDQVELLAVVADSEVEQGNIKAAGSDSVLRPLSLPYAIN
jgi:folate-binding protein YgfZ